MFLFGSDANNKGFGDTAVWDVYTKFKVSKAALDNTAPAAKETYADGTPETAAAAKFTGPTTVVTDAGAYVNGKGFKVKNTIIYQPDASTNFVDNGKLYSAAIQTLDQVTPSALAGIAWRKEYTPVNG